MSTQPLKVGFIGLSTTGWASRTLAPSLLSPSLSSSYILTAISTTSQDSALLTAEKYSSQLGRHIKPYWGNTSQIANDPDVDFLIVSVKSINHKEALEPVIKAGKPFFVEWPAGRGLEEDKAFAEAAKAKNLRNIVGLQGRQSLVVKKARILTDSICAAMLICIQVREILASGKIGQIRSTHLIALFPDDFGIWGPKITEKAIFAAPWESGATGPHIGGGHLLAPFLSFLGPLTSISSTAFTAYPSPQVIGKDGQPTGQTVSSTGLDHLSFSGRLLNSGALASITFRSGHKSSPGRTQLLWEIEGDEGSIRISSESANGAYIGLTEPDLFLNGEKIKVKEVEGYEGVTGNLKRAWEEYAKGEEGDYATLEDALEIHRVLDGVKRSAEEGVTIKLH